MAKYENDLEHCMVLHIRLGVRYCAWAYGPRLYDNDCRRTFGSVVLGIGSESVFSFQGRQASDCQRVQRTVCAGRRYLVDQGFAAVVAVESAPL